MNSNEKKREIPSARTIVLVFAIHGPAKSLQNILPI